LATGFVWHESYFWHDTGSGFLFSADGKTVQPLAHPESPESKRRIKSLLDITGLSKKLTHLEPRPATHGDILRVHTCNYYDRVWAMNDTGGDAGGLTPFGKGSVEIALLATGGVIRATEAVWGGEVDNAFALVRPPGHHAVSDSGMGFCIFNNNAVAARYLQAVHGVQRIAIVDWDVHHGNGAQDIFYADPSVLTISLHQDNCFPPDSGHISQTGAGAGDGYNLNIPLPPGASHEAYIAAWSRVVIPALHRFQPEFIFVASGLDANGMDPLARMLATSQTFREMTHLTKDAAATLCGGKLVIAHEGGYSAAYVPYCGLAVVEALCGELSGLADPYLPIVGPQGHPLALHEDQVIRQAEQRLDKIKSLKPFQISKGAKI
jgi:acetoin utilization deacetylase AcuC-like enzyme